MTKIKLVAIFIDHFLDVYIKTIQILTQSPAIHANKIF